MGLFDLFKAKKGPGTPPPGPHDKNVARLARVAGDRHAQNYDRMEALNGLAQITSSESAAALLKRFTFYIEPSITDQEEKEVAFRGIVACGEAAVEPVLEFCERAESLTWPLKILGAIVPHDRYVDEVLNLLENHETDYSRNVDPKLQLLGALEGEKREDARTEVARFLGDASEPVRFQAVTILLSMDEAEVVGPLVDMAQEEESLRIKNKIAETIATRGWEIPAEKREAAQRAFAGSGYVISGGKLTR